MSVTELLENFGLDHKIHWVERRPVLLQARKVYMVVSRSKFWCVCSTRCKCLPFCVPNAYIVRSHCRFRVVVRVTGTDWDISSGENKSKGQFRCCSRRPVGSTRRRNHWQKNWHIRRWIRRVRCIYVADKVETLDSMAQAMKRPSAKLWN